MMDYLNFDCFVCCLFSYGVNGRIYGIDSVLVEINDIIVMFKGVVCLLFVNKFKLFFI